MKYIVAFWLVTLFLAYTAGVAGEQGHYWAALLIGLGILAILVLAVIPESKQKRH